MYRRSRKASQSPPSRLKTMVSRSRSLCLAIHGDVRLRDMGEDRDIARHQIAGITAASRTCLFRVKL
jgi:hypothetical protein